MSIEAWGRDAAVDEAVVDAEVEAYIEGHAPAREPWAIRTMDEADWCLVRVAKVRALLAEYDDTIALWKNARARMERAAEWHEARLKEWAIDRRAPGMTSVTLGHGTIRTTKRGPAVEIVDEDAAIEWARVAAPEAIRTTESLLVTKLKDVVRIDDVVTGWRVIDRETGETIEYMTPAEMAEIADGQIVSVEVPGRRVSIVNTDGEHVATADAELAPGVVDAAGVLVPGLSVRPAKISASIGEVLL